MAPRLAVRKRLAGWLRRWSARAARAASALEHPATAPAPEVRDGPPEHWRRLVAERAPELLEGRGIRVGMPSPHANGKMPPMPDVSRPSPEPPPRPALRSGGVVDSWPPDRHRAPAGDRPHSVAAPTPARAAVSPASPAADSRRAGWGTPQMLRQALTRLMPWRIIRARPKDGTSPPAPHGSAVPLASAVPPTSAAPPRVRTAVEARSAGTPTAGAAAVWTTSVPVSAAQDEPLGLPTMPAWTRPGLTHGDWAVPDHGTADARWPRPPSGGPWPWAAVAAGTAGTADDRWPELPDDGPLWTTPATAFTDDRVRRLDAEQQGV